MLKKIEIVVIRVDMKTGELLNSQPCWNCTRKMKLLGIRKIHFSNDKGEIETHNLRDFEPTHICTSQKKLYYDLWENHQRIINN